MPSQVQYVFDPAFREAWENVPHRVYGFGLKPFSAWHRLCLEMIASPALTGEAITVLELYAAAKVCSSSYGYVPDLSAPKGWLRRMGLRYRLRRHGVQAELAKFRAYLEDFDASPKFWPTEDSGPNVPQKCAEMDRILELVSHVIKETGWSEATVWNLAIGKLNWYSAAFVKLSGTDVPFWTPQDEEAYKRHVAERDAKLKAEAEAKAAADGISFEKAHEAVKTEYWEKVRLAKLQAKLQATRH